MKSDLSLSLLTSLFGVILVLQTPIVSAALAPKSAETLEKNAVHIVTGRVVKVSSKNEKAVAEKSLGIHRDKVYTIKLKVESISKGKGIKQGDEIELKTWKADVRIPPLSRSSGTELDSCKRAMGKCLPEEEKRKCL